MDHPSTASLSIENHVCALHTEAWILYKFYDFTNDVAMCESATEWVTPPVTESSDENSRNRRFPSYKGEPINFAVKLEPPPQWVKELVALRDQLSQNQLQRNLLLLDQFPRNQLSFN